MSSFLLVHGAWHSAACWHRTAGLLEAAGHRVLTPDLPGHGAEAVSASRVSLRHQVAALVEQLSDTAGPFHVVAHSMAGVPATVAVSQAPAHVASLTYLAAFLPRPGDSVFGLMAANRAHEPLTRIELAMHLSQDKRTCTVATDEAAELFYHDLPAEEAVALAQQLQPQSTLVLAADAHFDALPLAAIPRSYIACRRDRVLPFHHQQRMLQRVGALAWRVLDSDHSPFHSRPFELADLLQATCRT
jgi:pimeloyl-ACP methyl ester carboxylesterase